MNKKTEELAESAKPQALEPARGGGTFRGNCIKVIATPQERARNRYSHPARIEAEKSFPKLEFLCGAVCYRDSLPG